MEKWNVHEGVGAGIIMQSEMKMATLTIIFTAILLIVVLAFLVTTYARNRVYRDDVSLYSDTTMKSPKKIRSFNNRGEAYKKMGLFDKAIADFNTAIALDPSDGQICMVYSNRGATFTRMGLFDRAMADYEKAIALNPSYFATYNNRGITFDENGQHDKAIKDYATAIALNPYFADAYYNRGTTYVLIGQYGNALEDFSETIMLNQSDSMAYLSRGQLYFSLGKKERAIADLKKACELGNSDGCNALRVLFQGARSEQRVLPAREE